MVSPHANSHAHQHEWRMTDDAIVEDGALYLSEQCDYVEERHAGYSARHDEDFYETMYECGAERSHRFDITGIERVYDVDGGSRLRGDDIDATETLSERPDVFEMDEDVALTLLEKIELDAAERLENGYADDRHPLYIEFGERYEGVDTSPHYITVTFDVPAVVADEVVRLDEGETVTYRLRFEQTALSEL